LQWTGHAVGTEVYRVRKKGSQRTVHSKRRVRKPKKRWEDGVTEGAVPLFGTWAGKTKAKGTESWWQRIEKAKSLGL
jgi:hypothetical protein